MFHDNRTNSGGDSASLVRMSHRQDPDTSAAAAECASTGTKKELLYGAIVGILRDHGPATAKEIHHLYAIGRDGGGEWLPVADVYDIRRRLSELKRDLGRVVDSGDRRNGEAVMALAKAGA